jgi:hypothetical protein
MIVRQLDRILGEKKSLLSYQRGQKRPVKFSAPYLEQPFGGMLPREVLVIAGPTSSGKTYNLQKLKADAFDKDLNPNCDNFVWLDYSLEMKLQSLILRDLAAALKKPKADILFNEFKPEELSIVSSIFEKFSNERIYIHDTPLTPEMFKDQTLEFCEQNRDKDAVFISIDHLALIRGGSSKTATIGETLSYINELKLMYDNTFFILLSQMSPDYFRRLSERDRSSQPQLTDLFYSSEINMLCDYLVVVTSPERFGITEYSSFNPDRYPYLQKYMTEVGKNGKVSFETEGLIFYHLLKSRENDMGYDDIFIHELYPRVEKTVQAATKTEYIAKSAKNEWESLFKGGEEEQKITPNKNYSVEDFNDLPF